MLAVYILSCDFLSGFSADDFISWAGGEACCWDLKYPINVANVPSSALSPN
jgi:hypothetical protein